jgi:hypothetical protein
LGGRVFALGRAGQGPRRLPRFAREGEFSPTIGADLMSRERGRCETGAR